jgi:hypothetical protein
LDLPPDVVLTGVSVVTGAAVLMGAVVLTCDETAGFGCVGGIADGGTAGGTCGGWFSTGTPPQEDVR